MANKMELQFVFLIVELVMKHGVPAVIKAITAWQVEDPTAADYEELKEIVKDPESYFETD
jgi:hypothetical protein